MPCAWHPPWAVQRYVEETRHGHGRPGVGPVITQLRTGEAPACFLLQGVLFGGRPDRGRGVPASGPSRAARHVVADLWRQADHYVTRPRRSSRLFPKRVFYSAGDPTRGRLDLNLRSGTQTIASSPDLCKSGAESVKICFFQQLQRNTTGTSVLTEYHHTQPTAAC